MCGSLETFLIFNNSERLGLMAIAWL